MEALIKMRHPSIELILGRERWIGEKQGASMKRLRAYASRGLLGVAAFSMPLATSRAEPVDCIPRKWAVSIVDPNLADADSYTADTSIFVEAGTPRIFYAKGPIGIDDWQRS